MWAGKDSVLELMEGYIDGGHTRCTDYFYSSVTLAGITLRKNRRGVPKEIKKKRFQRGQPCYKQKRNVHFGAHIYIVHKTSKWYKKIFFHSTQTAVVNAWKLYKDAIGKVRLNDFRMDVVESLLNAKCDCARDHSDAARPELEEVSGPKNNTRRRCTGCYSTTSKEQGRV
ncbi:hypothetical protein COOONC_08119, partial [Cooperia oncophora]